MTRSSPTPKISEIKSAAIEAAREAGAVLRFHFGKTLKIEEKQGAGLVTNADREAENKTIEILKRVSSEMGFLAEESSYFEQGAREAEASIGRWVIDPLDGTTNFIHGFPMFCVSIAAELFGELAVGVVYHPILEEMYVASRGEGATLNGERLEVSQTSKIEDSLLTTGFSYLPADELVKEVRTFGRLSARARAIRRPGSAALDLAYVARGVFDGFWERGLSAWDVAAGMVLIQEAGGKTTDFQGHATDIKKGEIVASNGGIHSELIAEIHREV